MRTKKLLFCLLVALGFLKTSAQPINDIFSQKEKMVWLGLDFTAAKLVGDRRGWGTPGRAQHVMASMNNLIEKESRKYDIADALNRRRIQYDVQVTLEHNRKLNMENAIVDKLNGHFLNSDDIQQIVSLYDFDGMNGTGILFIVETFNKPAMEAVVWVTFVNLGNKEVLMSKKMVEEPVGFGVRNFWAGSIYKMLKQIKKRDYDLWRREYARKK